MKSRWCVILLLGLTTFAQSQNLVHLLHANTLSFDESRIPDAQILRGEVIFRHDDALMYCDSAYFYEKKNSLYAFSHVRFEQGDTLFGYGDAMYYDGNTKLARLRRHVKLVNGQTVLTTDSLNYNRKRDLAYYFGTGKIVDDVNTLTSYWGQYNPSTKQALFKQDVYLTNPRFTLTSDTLCYNTEQHVADIVSPTTIVYEEETTILSSLGEYNTETEQSHLYQRSKVLHNDGTWLTGDTIYYDKKAGFGRILGAMELIDSTQHVTLYGNKGEFYEERNRGMATDSALLVDWGNTDYTYIHADSLFTEDVPWTDSLARDSIYMLARAYHRVRVYRVDLQAVTDSLVYETMDSIMTLYRHPICWNDDNQFSANEMKIYMVNGHADHIYGEGAAFVAMQDAEDYFNQLSGKEVTGYIVDNTLKRVEMSGNAQTVFYPKDDNEYTGLNRTESSFVNIYFENKEVHHVRFTESSTGIMYPMDQIPPNTDRLSGFFWAKEQRPMFPGDVFRIVDETQPIEKNKN